MNEINQEIKYKGLVMNGFVMLLVILLLCVATAASFVYLEEFLFLPIIMTVAAVIMLGGFFIQQPNQAHVMIFFGKYRGSFRDTGFFWINPFMTTKKISLRIRNMDIAPIKVNDKIGNPVMIGMVLVWKVQDPYRAIFDIDAESTGDAKNSVDSSSLEQFVRIQSDAALREVTGKFAYDDENSHGDTITLRSDGQEISEHLQHKLNERLSMAGIEVVEARLNYLAYAPEIAAVMLRRQQAAAIISAREKIVEGAVSMVKMALDELDEQNIVALDPERKAAMVSNLLVVLCADEPAQPVLNTGSLYQ